MKDTLSINSPCSVRTAAASFQVTRWHVYRPIFTQLRDPREFRQWFDVEMQPIFELKAATAVAAMAEAKAAGFVRPIVGAE